MPETPIPAPPGFSQLSKAEQVRYLQALWDQIAENPAGLPVPESHLKLVEQRLRRHRDNPSPAHSAFEVLDRLPCQYHRPNGSGVSDRSNLMSQKKL